MKTVRVTMSDEAYEALRNEAKGKFPGVASYLLAKAGGMSDDALAADIAKKALVRAKQRDINQPFRVKDLFKDTEWEGFSVGVRIRTGRQFQTKVNGNKYPMLQPLGKDDANHQTYKRVF